MKKILWGAFMCVLLGAGCTSASSSTLSESDFVPPTGAAENPPPASAGERRLVTATSTDGVHFTATGEVFTEQGNVPDAVVADDGTIYLYYIGQGIEEGRETTAVAISTDDGASWTYHFLTLNNWPSNRAPSDPDVVLRDDGTFRMYYTDNVDGPLLGIAYGDSTDGLTFTYKGIALSPNSNLLDSSTMYFDGMWHMFVLDEKKGIQHHATSSDGTTFTLASSSEVVLPKPGYITGNALINDDTLRMFAFSLADRDIRSFTTTDGVTWKTGDIALDATEESTLGSNYIQDMAVAELSDGSYLMVYVVEYEK